mgnify:CR=1 FL=1
MFKRESVIAVILLILLINIGFSSAITGAIGNAKMVLYPEVNGRTNTVIEKSILVKNPNDVVVNITLQLDPEAEKFIELVDKNFLLEPYSEKTAEFVIKVKEPGTYDGKIAILFSDTVEKKTGVALSSEIVVIAKKSGSAPDAEKEVVEETEDGNSTGKNESAGWNPLTGSAIFGESDSALAVGVIGSTIILVIVVIVLMIILYKRLKKKGEKRRKKVNARKKP